MAYSVREERQSLATSLREELDEAGRVVIRLRRDNVESFVLLLDSIDENLPYDRPARFSTAGQLYFDLPPNSPVRQYAHHTPPPSISCRAVFRGDLFCDSRWKTPFA